MVRFSELRDEHHEVLQKTEALNRAITSLATGRIAEAMPILRDYANFINRAILPHFNLKEKVILPILVRHSKRSKDLAAMLSEEHTFLRECFERYCRLIEEDPLNPTLAELCRGMCSKLLEHAHKEDEVIIPLLRKYLGIGEDEELPGHAPTINYQERE